MPDAKNDYLDDLYDFKRVFKPLPVEDELEIDNQPPPAVKAKKKLKYIYKYAVYPSKDDEVFDLYADMKMKSKFHVIDRSEDIFD